MGTREIKVENYLKKKVEELGGTCYKWVSPGRRYVPDRIILLNGVVYFVEVKTSDGLLSPGQTREIERLTNNGANAHVVKGCEQVDSFIDFVKRV